MFWGFAQKIWFGIPATLILTLNKCGGILDAYMKKSSKKNKEITNLELLQSINRSFSRVEKKMATKEELKNLEAKMATKTDIEGLRGQIEGVNKRIDDLAVNRVKYEDHNKLKSRVDFLETKS